MIIPISESQISPHTFSPNVTLRLQALLGTDGFIAGLASVYYNFPMMTNIDLLFVGVYFAPRGKKGRVGWVYGIAILMGGLIDSIIYLIFPVAPPIRVPDHLQQGVVQVRLGQLPWSDDLITLKYSALPSGHIFYSIFGYLLCREEGFTLMGRFYQINTLVFSLIILYLGEHYVIDIIGAFLLAICVFYITTRYLDTKHPTFHQTPEFRRKTVDHKVVG